MLETVSFKSLGNRSLFARVIDLVFYLFPQFVLIVWMYIHFSNSQLFCLSATFLFFFEWWCLDLLQHTYSMFVRSFVRFLVFFFFFFEWSIWLVSLFLTFLCSFFLLLLSSAWMTGWLLLRLSLFARQPAHQMWQVKNNFLWHLVFPFFSSCDERSPDGHGHQPHLFLSLSLSLIPLGDIHSLLCLSFNCCVRSDKRSVWFARVLLRVYSLR